MGTICHCKQKNFSESSQFILTDLAEQVRKKEQQSPLTKPQGLSELPKLQYLSEEDDDLDLGEENKKNTHRASFLLKLLKNQQDGEIRFEFSKSESPVRRQQNQQFYEMIIKYQQEMNQCQMQMNSKKKKHHSKQKLTQKSCSPRKSAKQIDSSGKLSEKISFMNQFNFYYMQPSAQALVSPTRKRKPRGEMHTQIIQSRFKNVPEGTNQQIRSKTKQFSQLIHQNNHSTSPFSPTKNGILKKNSRTYSGYHYHNSEIGSFNSTRKKRVHFTGLYLKRE